MFISVVPRVANNISESRLKLLKIMLRRRRRQRRVVGTESCRAL